MKDIKIEVVKGRKMEKEFINVPKKIYKGDKSYVPNFDFEALRAIRGKTNTLVQSGDYKHVLAYKGDLVCGRATVGINDDINKAKNIKEGYIALFECVDDLVVAKSIFNYCIEWLKQKGMNRVLGPLALPNGEDYRGVLIDNFEDPTLIMNTYNKPYYKKLFEKCGFEKYWDCYAYRYDLKNGIKEKYEKLIPYAMRKYKFKVEKLDKKNIDREVEAIKEIIDKAMPEEWMEFIPPDDKQINIIKKHLFPIAVADYIYIARTEDGQPIGFNVALPDYNQPLKAIEGKLSPLRIVKFLKLKNKINRLRVFVMFIIPEYRKKGVAGAIYYNCYKACVKNGYDYIEGSTVWEYNETMMRDVVKAGAKKNKTYRIYEKNF